MPKDINLPETVDVVIVGAGPVGLTIANYLGSMGVQTLVIEQRETLIDYPRGVGMDDECLRSFQAVGLGDEIASHTTPDQKMRFVTQTGKTFALIHPTTREFGWPRRNSFIQPMVDEILCAGIDRFDSARLVFGVELLKFEQTDDEVSLTVSSGGQEKTISTKWLVGCDGGRSIVRKSLDIPFDGITDSTRWVVIDILDDPVGLPDTYLHCVPSRPYVSIALPHGMRRLEFMVFGEESEEELCSDEGVQKLMARVLPDPASANILRSRVYTHNARLARKFRAGRVLLCGDASHLMPVWQGQGYNTGVRDATNLAWKLGMVARGEASPEMLDTYEMERREHTKAMIDLSVTAGKIFAPTNRLVAWARDKLALAMNTIPPIKRYLVEMRFKPMPRFRRGVVLTDKDGQPEGNAAGRLFPQPNIVTAEGAVNRLDDVIGIHFAILSWGSDPQRHLSPDFCTYWQQLGAKFIMVIPKGQLADFRGHVSNGTHIVGDASGAFHDWFSKQEADGSIVVLRPDRIVAGIVSPQRLEQASARLRAIIGGKFARSTTQPVRTSKELSPG